MHLPVWDHAQKQTRLTHRAASSFAVSSGFFGGQWHEIHPQYWTKYQVWEWLQHLLDTNQLDASCIPFQEFDINGEHLCSMSLQEFTRAAGTAGAASGPGPGLGGAAAVVSFHVPFSNVIL